MGLSTTGERSSAVGNQLFVKTVVWKFRSDALWRDVPEHLRDLHNSHRRFSCWAEKALDAVDELIFVLRSKLTKSR
jgi:hypothetical protein